MSTQPSKQEILKSFQVIPGIGKTKHREKKQQQTHPPQAIHRYNLAFKRHPDRKTLIIDILQAN